MTDSLKSGNKIVGVTPLGGGWHHTEIISQLGSTTRHFTNEATKKHYYAD